MSSYEFMVLGEVKQVSLDSWFFLLQYIYILEQENLWQARQDESTGEVQEDGTVLFMKSDGTYETAEQRDRRLAHNTRMQFNRSLESSSLEALMALWGKHISIYIYGENIYR